MTSLTKRHSVRSGLRVALAVAVVVGAFRLASGESRADTGTFANYTAIISHSTGTDFMNSFAGPADPYPSPITVSGLNGTVAKVTVKLNQFTTYPMPFSGESFPEDADVMLSAPDGVHNLVVMSDVGGDDTVSHNVDHIDLVVDDDAPTIMPMDTQLYAGTYKPTDDDNDMMNNDPSDPDVDRWDEVPPTYGAPTPSSATTFAEAFNGLDPNGTWKLWVWDDRPTADFGFEGGWCLNITTNTGSASGGNCTVPPTTGMVTTSSIPAPSSTTTMAPMGTTTTTMAPMTTTTAPPPTTTTTTPPAPSGTTVFPSTVKVSTGTATGNAASLAADDNNYYVDKSSTKVTSWFGTFTNVPKASAKSLRVTYVGKQSQSASQVVYVYRYSTGNWVAVNTTTVGTSEMTTSFVLGGSPSDWISGTGQMKIRVKSTATSGALTTSADLLSVSYTT